MDEGIKVVDGNYRVRVQDLLLFAKTRIEAIYEVQFVDIRLWENMVTLRCITRRDVEDSEISEKLFNEMVQCGMLQCVWRIAEDQVCKHCAALLPDHSKNCATTQRETG